MTTTTGRARRPRVLRLAMIAGACPGLTGATLIVYVLGFRIHPHRVSAAVSFAGAYVALVLATNWLIYRISRRQP